MDTGWVGKRDHGRETTMTNDEIKNDIVTACEDFQAAGYLLVKGTYATEKDEPCGGCALTAVAFVHGGVKPKYGQADRIIAFACKRYGWDKDQCTKFVDGYDDLMSDDDELIVLGRAVRDDVQPAF